MARVKAFGPTPEERILGWFRELDLTIPPASPMALRWENGGCIEVPVAEAIEDVDLVFTPDVPDLEMLADGCAYMVRDAERTFPGRRSWQRWALTSWLSRWLYVTGITRSGGSTSWDGGDPIGKAIYTLPRLRDVPPRRGGTMRPYLLGKRSWWWECHHSQGWRVRGRHMPLEPFASSICAACLPCPECGAPYECKDDCPTLEVPCES